MQRKSDQRVVNVKSHHKMNKLLRYPTILFLLLYAASVMGMHKGDRCELRGFFGVTHEEPSKEKLASLGYQPKGGTIVSNVIGCTAALDAGIQPMDYLYAVNGKTAVGSTGFFCLMHDFLPGESFQIDLLRAGTKKTVTVTLGRRSDACQNETPFPKRGFFGIRDTESDRQPGVLIEVSTNGPVAQLGLRDGDRLLRINGYPIADYSDLAVVKRLITDTSNVNFEFTHNGKSFNITGPIPVRQYIPSDWRSNQNVFENSADEMRQAFDDIDFDEIKAEIRSAVREGEQETESAINEAMSSMRRAMNSFRSRGGNWEEREEYVYTPDIDPSDLDVRVEQPTVDDFLDIEDLEVRLPQNRDLKVTDFSASPNPSQGEFDLSFNLPTKGETSIVIYSSEGREIYAFDLGEYNGLFNDELDIMRNGPGTYYLLVRQDDQVFVRKIILVER
jgi:hypothetical protein